MDCIQMHLQTRFAYNAAENQRLYVMCGLKKSPKVSMRQFCECVATLNDAIDFLPMRFYSPKATEHTIKTEKYDDMTMVGNIMRALPESWQNDLLKSVQGVTPETTGELLPLLELVERSPPSGAMPPIPNKEKPTDVSSSGGKRRGGKHQCREDKRQNKGTSRSTGASTVRSTEALRTLTPLRSVSSIILMARPSPPKLERIGRPTRLSLHSSLSSTRTRRSLTNYLSRSPRRTRRDPAGPDTNRATRTAIRPDGVGPVAQKRNLVYVMITNLVK
jgi:hypothetical protein